MSPQLTPKKKKIMDFIEKYLKKHGYSPTLEEIAKKLKVSSKSTIHQHLKELEESGYLSRGENKARDIMIMGQRDLEETHTDEDAAYRLPVAGLITAGEPIEAVEDKTETMAVPPELVKNPNTYLLRVKGDSMVESLIADGDYVVVEKKDYANNGDIVVALLEDGSATLKEFHKEKNYIRLQPRNKNYEPLKVKNVIIQGKVVGIIRKFNQYIKIKYMSYSKKSNLPVEYLPGIGKRTARVLKALEIRTVGKFLNTPEKVLVELFGPSIKRAYAQPVRSVKRKKVQKVQHNKNWFQKVQLASQFISML